MVASTTPSLSAADIRGVYGFLLTPVKEIAGDAATSRKIRTFWTKRKHF